MDSDPSPAQIAGRAPRQNGNSGLYQLAGDLAHGSIVPQYFNWNGTKAGELKSPRPPGSRAIADFIGDYVRQYPRDRLAIVGNSWGGHTALEVITMLSEGDTPLALQMAVFLDASSAGRGNARRKAPINVNRIVHYHTRNVFVWGALPADKRLETIDLGDPNSGFMQNGLPAYNAPFDFSAHVAAEWDERIHRDIERRLLDLVPAE